MLKSRFGIEIEFTGVTRRKASEIVAKFFNSTVVEEGTYYDTKSVKQADGRNQLCLRKIYFPLFYRHA